ncbi:MAG: cation diffusion facilitator family transporter [Lentisphaeria bacterium]|nr:cation diffusion facilitator family transporter [Lentisphaeria bacterium]
MTPLTALLLRIFVPDYKHPEKASVRLQYGLLAGFVGIAVNILLFIIKFFIGLLAGSVAMAADAVNNLSDAGSAIIMVLGFKLSAKPADNEHPFGHGRLEYVAGLIVAVIIVAVGFDFLKEGVIRIFTPVRPEADNTLLCIFGGTLLFKVWLFFFYRGLGKQVKSEILRAVAFDSLSDLLSTSAVLGAVIGGKFTDFPIDGCAGVLVALLVIWGGIGIMRDTINPLLGALPDRTLVEELKRRLLACDGICGVHDIIIHNYGPNQYFATAHAEVNRNNQLTAAHDIMEAAEVKIAQTMPIRLLLHCDPYNTDDPVVIRWRSRMEEEVMKFDCKFKLYDFHLDKIPPCGVLHFQLLIPRNYALDEDEIRRCLSEAMQVYDKQISLHIDFNYAFV